MATMPKKKSLTAKRVLSLFLAYVLLCLAGGVVTSAFFLPAVFASNLSLIHISEPTRP